MLLVFRSKSSTRAEEDPGLEKLTNFAFGYNIQVILDRR